MTRILQCLVWITVMTASGRTQRGYSYSYLQNPRSISFLNTRSQENYEQPRNRHTEHNTHSDLQDPRRQRIQNRVSDLRRTENGYRIQLSKRGAIEPEPSSSIVVFPGPTSKSRFEPEISDECRKRGYCMRIPNYPTEKVKQLIATLGGDVRQKFQMDELDTDNVQIAQRFGSEAFRKGLCNSYEMLIEPDSLPDKNDVWWTVLQDRDNNMTQRFRAEICDKRGSSCNPLVSFPPGYQNECDQKFVLRSVLIVENNKAVAQKSLRLPSCCSCIIITPSI